MKWEAKKKPTSQTDNTVTIRTNYSIDIQSPANFVPIVVLIFNFTSIHDVLLKQPFSMQQETSRRQQKTTCVAKEAVTNVQSQNASLPGPMSGRIHRWRNQKGLDNFFGGKNKSRRLRQECIISTTRPQRRWCKIHLLSWDRTLHIAIDHRRAPKTQAQYYKCGIEPTRWTLADIKTQSWPWFWMEPDCHRLFKDIKRLHFSRCLRCFQARSGMRCRKRERNTERRRK